MTDKKIVSLQAVPKQAKVVEEEKKYKVNEELSSRLESIVEAFKAETTYEVGENALSVIISALDLIQKGAVQDIFIAASHEEAIWLEGCFRNVGLGNKSSENPYKFIVLAEEALTECIELIKMDLLMGDIDE